MPSPEHCQFELARVEEVEVEHGEVVHQSCEAHWVVKSTGENPPQLFSTGKRFVVKKHTFFNCVSKEHAVLRDDPESSGQRKYDEQGQPGLGDFWGVSVVCFRICPRHFCLICVKVGF